MKFNIHNEDNMSRFSKRSLKVFSAFVMATVFVVTGCTDAMIGPDVETNDDRVVETADAAMLQHAEPLEAIDSEDIRGRLAIRFWVPDLPGSVPLPDSLQAPDSSSAPPMGRLRLPYGLLPPLSLPPDSSGTSPDSSGTGGTS